MSKNTRNRILLTALAALLLVVVAVGGTVAWLTDKSEQITNTFTTAGIDIDLTETMNSKSSEIASENDQWTMQLIPGTKASKNPIVSVVTPETDVEIYLFVKFTDTMASSCLSYESTLTAANGWNQGKGTDGEGADGIPADVWYRTVTANEQASERNHACTNSECDKHENLHWHLLKGDEVEVKSGMTKNQIADNGGTMTYKAYAIQTTGFDNAAKAWEEVSKPENTSTGN